MGNERGAVLTGRAAPTPVTGPGNLRPKASQGEKQAQLCPGTFCLSLITLGIKASFACPIS